ncbi:hypothetical protein [Streptomyces sp. SYSU K21746]
MNKSVSRLLTAGSVIASLALTTACTGDDGDKDAKAPATSAPSKPAGPPPLTAAQLEQAMVTPAELKGYTFKKIPAEEIPELSVPAKPAACQPLADMFMFASQPKAKARVASTLTGPDGTDEMDATVVSIGLLAHQEADAGKIVAGLRTASTSCKAYEHADMKYAGVKALADPKKGDESVSYQVEGVIDGDKLPMTFTVVRSGSTVVSFYAMNILDPAKAVVPPAVIDAQLAKLARVK